MINNDLYKKISTASLLIIAISVGYYLILFLPNEAKQHKIQEQLENERKCQEAGRILHKTDAGTKTAHQTQLRGEFKFDKEQNRCLYMSGSFSTHDSKSYLFRYILNTYTNSTISEYAAEKDKNGKFVDFTGGQGAFEKAEDKYFRD